MLLVLALLVFVQADTPSEGLTVSRGSSVCEADIAKFCASEKSESRCAQFKCLNTHVTELTGPCALYVQEKQLQKESCKNDTDTFCATEESRWGKRRCLIANVDKLNPTCAAYIKELMKEYEVSPTACDSDVTTLCASVTGFSQTLVCMKQNFEKLSQECRRFFWRLKRNSTYGHDDHDNHHEGSHNEESSSYRHEGPRREEGSERGGYRKKHEGGEGGERGSSSQHERHEGGEKGGKWGNKKHEGGEKGEGWKKWKGKKGGCTRKLKEACATDLTTNNCGDKEGLRDMKECLILKWSSLNKNCSEFILNPWAFIKGKSDDVPQESMVEKADVDTPVLVDSVLEVEEDPKMNKFEIENVGVEDVVAVAEEDGSE